MNLSKDKICVSVLILLAVISALILIVLKCMGPREMRRVPEREIMRLQKMGDEIKEGFGAGEELWDSSVLSNQLAQLNARFAGDLERWRFEADDVRRIMGVPSFGKDESPEYIYWYSRGNAFALGLNFWFAEDGRCLFCFLSPLRPRLSDEKFRERIKRHYVPRLKQKDAEFRKWQKARYVRMLCDLRHTSDPRLREAKSLDWETSGHRELEDVLLKLEGELQTVACKTGLRYCDVEDMLGRPSYSTAERLYRDKCSPPKRMLKVQYVYSISETETSGYYIEFLFHAEDGGRTTCVFRYDYHSDVQPFISEESLEKAIESLEAMERTKQRTL
jgi:hypothetical protein